MYLSPLVCLSIVAHLWLREYQSTAFVVSAREKPPENQMVVHLTKTICLFCVWDYIWTTLIIDNAFFLAKKIFGILKGLQVWCFYTTDVGTSGFILMGY